MPWTLRGTLGGPRPWSSEIVVNNAALVDGYNDGDGGVMADAPITVTGCLWRVGRIGQLVTGTGTLLVEILAGDSFGEGVVIGTANLAVGTQGALIPITASNLTANAVLRARHTLGSTGVAGKVHVQYRGVYR